MKKTNFVSGDTLVLTDKGYKEIQTLADQQVSVWNGVQFVQVKPLISSPYEELLTIYFSNGCILECGLYSEFILFNHTVQEPVYRSKAIDLLKGSTLLPYDLPHLIMTDELTVPSLDNPIENCIIQGDLSIRLMYLEELIKEYGHFHLDGDDDTINIAFHDTSNKQAYLDVLYLLHTLNIHSTIKNDSFFTNDPNNNYTLEIGSFGIKRLIALGLHLSYGISHELYSTHPVETINVMNVKRYVKFGKTYSVVEPMRGTVLFNGVLTG